MIYGVSASKSFIIHKKFVGHGVIGKWDQDASHWELFMGEEGGVSEKNILIYEVKKFVSVWVFWIQKIIIFFLFLNQNFNRF